MTIIFDIDGTLTKEQRKWAEPNWYMINECKRLIEKGYSVIVWSKNTKYATEFCNKYGINPTASVGKPKYIVDNEKHKWGRRLKLRTITPEEFIQCKSHLE